MSGKKILGIILITIIALAGVVGSIGFSFSDSKVTIGAATITNDIAQSGDLEPTYSGSIMIEQDVFIYNSGVLNLKDIVVDIVVYFTGTIDTAEVQVGEGTNNLGTIEAGANESKTITIDLNNKIARLAVEDGTFRIVINTNLQLQYIPYTIELPQQETYEQWDAPYGSVLLV